MRRSLLPLNALRVFDAALRTRSFTRAADELAVTPAAVGQQVRALEETLGVILFRRSPRGLEPTFEAERAAAALARGFQSLEEAVAALQEGQSADRLALAVCRPLLGPWLWTRLAAHRARAPQLVVSVLPLDGPVDFAEANLDLALSFERAPDAEGVFGRPLDEAERWLEVAAPGVDGPVLALDPAAASAGAGAVLADLGALLGAAEAGLGVARLPSTLAAEALAAGRLRLRADLGPCNERFWLSAPAPQWRAPKVRALVETLAWPAG